MPGQNYDILVIDDQAGVRWLICEALTGEGYSVDQAAGGYEALAKLKKNKYRLILLDIKMPGMNGMETFQEIRKVDEQVPVVLMTAYSELGMTGENVREDELVQYISKPFDLDDLRKLVHTCAPMVD